VLDNERCIHPYRRPTSLRTDDGNGVREVLADVNRTTLADDEPAAAQDRPEATMRTLGRAISGTIVLEKDRGKAARLSPCSTSLPSSGTEHLDAARTR
jgi:hypothetical protein